jgi:hypothetical protein
VIYLLAGEHEASNTAGTAMTISANKGGITMLGVPKHNLTPRTFLGINADDEILDLSEGELEIAYIYFLGKPAQATSGLVTMSSTNVYNVWIHDCAFDIGGAATNLGVFGLEATAAVSGLVVENCSFYTDSASGPWINLTGVLDSRITNNVFNHSAGTLAVGIQCGAGTIRVLIDHNVFMDGAGTVTSGIDGTGVTIANTIVIADNRFGSTHTVPVDNFDAAEAILAENYKMGVGATDGGTLIVAIT